MPDDEELELPDDDSELEEYEVEYCYGVEIPSLPEDLQPLEVVVLVKGIMMRTGQPTISALGSDGMSPWEACGMLRMESARLEHAYVFGGLGSGFEDDEGEEEDDDI